MAATINTQTNSEHINTHKHLKTWHNSGANREQKLDIQLKSIHQDNNDNN